MKLFQAIRKGMKGRTQCKKHFIRHKGQCVCVLGAAYMAVRENRPGYIPYINTARIQTMWPVLELKATHPVAGYSTQIMEIVVSLNDIYNWPIDRIADWLESLPETDYDQSMKVR